MTSAEHEAPVALVKNDPAVIAWLLTNVFGIAVPAFDHASARPGDLQVLTPRTYHADATVLLTAADEPVYAVVVEVQRARDPDKAYRWKQYLAEVEVTVRVTTSLVVHCADPDVARYYRRWAARDGGSLHLRPLIVTPDDLPLVVDAELAVRYPSLTVLSILMHSRRSDVDQAFAGLAEALRAIGPSQAVFYNDIVLAGLPPDSRARWRAFMTSTLGSRFFSEEFQQAEAKGRVEGEAKGRVEGEARGLADAVLTLLDARGVAVSQAVRDRIFGCTDQGQLRTWLLRAATAATIEDVTAD